MTLTCRYALRDDQWHRIKTLLPGHAGHVDVTARDNRLFVEAVLYRYRAGVLTEHFGDFRVGSHPLFALGMFGGMETHV